MKKYRIFIDLERTRKPYTGLFNYSYNLFLYFFNIKLKKLSFIFYTSKELAEKYKLNKNVVSFKFIHYFFNFFLYKSDIIHITWQRSYIIRMLNFLYRKKKVIYTIHDLNILYEKGYLEYKNQLKLMKKTADKATIITTISNFVKEDVIKFLGIDEKKIRTIYNGVNLVKYPNFEGPKNKSNNKFLFSMGMILPKKNFHTLIPLLVDNDYDLIIAGISNDKNYMEKIMNEAFLYGVNERVKLLGIITEEEKYWYYKNCEAFVFPSLFEGFGIPPIEAMSLGKPVFLSKCTSLPEIGGDVAYYFDDFDPEVMKNNFNDGMEDYLKNKEEKEKQLIEHSKLFSMENSINEYIKLYENLCRI